MVTEDTTTPLVARSLQYRYARVCFDNNRKCYNVVMLILDMFSWWYVQGWLQVAKNAWHRMIRVSNMFSVPILLRTLWAPWRRIITYPGASLEAKLRAFGDNLVSRCIGFTVRLLVLLTAGILLVLTGGLGVAAVICWPLVPLVVLGSLVKGSGLL